MIKHFALPAGRAAIDPLNKGLGSFDHPVEAVELAELGWNLLREHLSLPSAVLYRDRLVHNLNWMQQFISTYGLKLAPHGKTTMAPKLFQMQMEAGAWGITLATAHQVRVAYEHGVRRVLMANQLIGRQNMAVIASLIQDETFEFYCLVDSAALVDQLGQFFSEKRLRLRVLIELGVIGGRAGIRDEDHLQSVLAALSRWQGCLALSGLELYEGVLKDEVSIRGFLQRAVEVSRRLLIEGCFERAPFVLSGAGSAWYDVVAEEFAAARFGDAAEIVLRPGCYLTHDVGAYREANDRILLHNPIARAMHSSLRPALQVWAYVQSIPEPERAIIAMGKRDAAFDSGLPSPALHFRPGDVAPHPVPPHWELTKLMDQHAYMHVSGDDNVQVGDMVAFDISHPCLTFDKWRTMPVLNASYEVVDIIQTFF